jgi:uncharacterized membrane protein
MTIWLAILILFLLGLCGIAFIIEFLGWLNDQSRLAGYDYPH